MLHIFFSLTESSFEYVVGFKVVRLLDSNSTGTYSRALSIRILKFVWMWYILDHFNSNSVFKYTSAQLWRIYPSGKYRGLLANITLDTYRVFGFILKNCVANGAFFVSLIAACHIPLDSGQPSMSLFLHHQKRACFCHLSVASYHWMQVVASG